MPVNWKEWLERFYQVENEPGKRYSSRHQLALAISEGRNPGAVTEIERNGITTLERLTEVARATGENPIRILVMMETITPKQVERMGIPRMVTPEQAEALGLLRDLAPGVQREWLVIGQSLRRIQQGFRD